MVSSTCFPRLLVVALSAFFPPFVVALSTLFVPFLAATPVAILLLGIAVGVLAVVGTSGVPDVAIVGNIQTRSNEVREIDREGDAR